MMNLEMGKTILFVVILSIILSGCAAAQKRRQDYVNAHPELEDEMKQNILHGKIGFGMTKGQVIAAWGHPSRIHQPVGSRDVDEQWVYYDDSDQTVYCPVVYIYFKNGIVESWGECR